MFTTSVGCVAFLFGGLLAALGFAPSMLGGAASSFLEGWIDERIDGSIVIEGLDLAWDADQRVRGLQVRDPDGEEVLSVDLTLPSLFTMLDSEREPWRVHALVNGAKIRVHEDGTSNLEHALAFDGRRREELRIDRFDSSRGVDQDFSYALVVRGHAIEVRGPDPDRAPVEIRELDVRLEHEPRNDHRLEVGAEIAFDEDVGSLTFEGSIAPRRGLNQVQSFELIEIPTTLLDLWWGSAGRVEAVFGSSLSMNLGVSDDGSELERLIATLSGESGAEVAIDGVLESGTLLPGESGTLSAALPLTTQVLDELLGAYLPPQTRLDQDRNGADWTLTGKSFAIPTGLGTRDGFERGTFLAGLSAVFEVRSGGPLGLVPQERPDEDPGLRLWGAEELVTTFELTAGGAPSMDVVGRDERGRAAFRVVLESNDALADLVAGGGSVGMNLHSPSFPTRMIDHMSGQDGWLALLLGSQVELDLVYPRLGPPVAPANLRIRAHDGRSEVSGELGSGALRSGVHGHLAIDVLFTPRVYEALIAPLLPWIEIDKPQGAGPARLTLEEFELPYGGDLAGLRGKLRLDLGLVRYRLHQRLRNSLYLPDRDAWTESELLPMRMTLGREGMVAYDELSLVLQDGEEYDFEGSIDLVEERLNLESQLPIQFLSPAPTAAQANLDVPIMVSGEWDRPDLSIDFAWLRAINERIDQLWGRAPGGDGGDDE